MGIQTILFDMDGTIADTERTAGKVLLSYFQKLGHKLSDQELEQFAGRPWAYAAKVLGEQFSIPSDQLEREVLNDYRVQIARQIDVIPGSVEAIHSLSQHYTLGLVSGSRREDIQTVLKTLKVVDLFAIILGFEDCSEGKPSPVPFRDAMELLHARPEETLVFEDSVAGIESALAAGTRVVTVGKSATAVDPRPATTTVIENFIGIDSAWVKKRFG